MTFKDNTQMLFTGGIQVGSASDSLHSVAGATGRATMTGSARVYKYIWLPATDWYGIEPDSFANAYNATATAAGSTPTVLPMGLNFGKAAGSTVQVPVLAASQATNLDSRAATVFFAPDDADSSASVQVQLYYTTKVAMATTGSMEVFRLHWLYLGTGGSANLAAAGNSGSIVYGASMATVGNGKLEVQTLGSIDAFSSTSPLVALQLTLEQSNASCMAGSAEEAIFGMRLRYVANSMGTAV